MKTSFLINPLKPNGNYMYHLFQQSETFHFVFMGFVWFSLWTGIISLNSINYLIFVMVKSCVFFAVRTEFLNIIYTRFGFKWLKIICMFFLSNNNFSTSRVSTYKFHEYKWLHTFHIRRIWCKEGVVPYANFRCNLLSRQFDFSEWVATLQTCIVLGSECTVSCQQD
jgi:hypothetical protein